MPALATLEREKRLSKVSIARIQSRILDYLKKPVNQEVIDYLELDLDDLRSEKLKFDEIQKKMFPEMLAHKDEAKSEQDIENEWGLESEKIRASIVTMVCRVNAAKRLLDSSSSRESLLNTTFRESSEQPTVRLPKIEVPTFSGDIRDWNDFSNLFKNLVHDNPGLSNVQRLYYLKLAMKGTASDLIKDYTITEANYHEVWTALTTRYENKRATIKAHLNDFFGLSKIKSEREVRKLLDESSKAIRSLKALGENVDGWNTIITYWITTRLDDKSAREWEISITDFSKYPSLKQLKMFLAARAAIWEDASGAPKVDKVDKKFEPKKNPEPKPKTNLLTAKIRCYVCSANHYLSDCEEFKRKEVDQRFEIIKANNLCVNCFCRKHSTSECKGQKCRRCDRKHHTLLHRSLGETKELSRPTTSPNEDKNIRNENKVSLQIAKGTTEVLLPTAVVKVETDIRKDCRARIIFDSGSQANLVSESLIKRLKIPTIRSGSVLGGLVKSSIACDFACNLLIMSRFSDKKVLMVTADVVPYIPYKAPSKQIEQLQKIAKVNDGAEIEFLNGNVEILIGAEHFEKSMLKGRRFYDDIAIRGTIFGEIMFGKMSAEYKLMIPPTSRCFLTIEDQLRKFWESEEVEVQESDDHESDDHESNLCEKHFIATIARNSDGRFVARLPFKERNGTLSKLYFRAENSLLRLERKCSSDLKYAINEFMLDYQNKGHMKINESKVVNKYQYFIPFQIVERPKSATTRVRVVFNASAKTKGSFSLNDILMKGPQIQADILSILANFRRFQIAFTADIKQMYRQIAIDPRDSKYQKILWRYEPEEVMKEFELTTLTYGTTPASFIATRCLKMIADNVREKYPRATCAIANEFYMDNLMTGAASVDEAQELQTHIHEILSEYCLPLRKYVSNSPELIRNLENELLLSTDAVKLGSNDEVSVLGLIWKPSVDKFQIKLNLPTLPATTTKRTMLSELSRIFDPLGCLAPATIKGKLLLQKLWLHQLNWDQEIPRELQELYFKFRKQLNDINDFYIDRKLCAHSSHDFTTLCGFCDASEKAYAAVIYFRCSYQNQISSYIICAKTRVAPLKNSTIPRLELRGAELLVELVRKVAPIFKIPICNVICFTDSTVVLGWLNKSPDELKIFVSNRVKKIVKTIPAIQWSHVKGIDNPADLATRGLKVKDCGSNLWLRGPTWLCEGELYIKPIELNFSNLPEVKRSKNCMINVIQDHIVFKLIERCSKYVKLLNIVAYVLKFIENCRNPRVTSDISSARLSKSELHNALVIVVRAVQSVKYSKEIEDIKRKGTVSRKSSLFLFHPFLDDEKILRVGGRLANSSFSYDKKHPILLPAKNDFTKLYFSFLHIKYYHASVSFLITYATQKFRFVTGAKNVAKKVCRDCVTCRRFAGNAIQQVMGQLPKDRASISRPFSIVGVDYAGPLNLKPITPRSKIRFKGYIAIFVCYCTRAVHIETVSSLTTAAFFAALKRFTSRRGCPSVIYSDNATNFWGAANLLDDINIDSYPLEQKITWKFNPPRAPHFGGVFEAAIRSMKKHLTKVIGGQILTFEELTTLSAEIEAILNSRPIALNSIEDLENYITPGHFLTGTHLLIPASDDDTTLRLSTRWQLTQALKKSFWKHWRNDYINGFHKYGKWHSSDRDLAINDVVFLKDDQVPPFKYLLGRVTKLFPGVDGKVRVAEVFTKNGSFLRAVTKLSSAVGSMLKDQPT